MPKIIEWHQNFDGGYYPKEWSGGLGVDVPYHLRPTKCCGLGLIVDSQQAVHASWNYYTHGYDYSIKYGINDRTYDYLKYSKLLMGVDIIQGLWEGAVPPYAEKHTITLPNCAPFDLLLTTRRVEKDELDFFEASKANVTTSEGREAVLTSIWLEHTSNAQINRTLAIPHDAILLVFVTAEVPDRVLDVLEQCDVIFRQDNVVNWTYNDPRLTVIIARKK
jgi:hypothetical protein